MANRLFDTPDLVEVEYGDGMWTIGFDLQATRGAVTLQIQDPCTSVGAYIAGARDASSPNVYTITAFAATMSARRNLRCASGEELSIISQLLADGGAVGAAEYGLWHGAPGWDPNVAPSLMNNDVHTVSAGATVADSIGVAITAYSTLTAYPYYVVHLGVDAAIDLSALGYTETIDQAGQLRLRATGAPIVVSPYYPPSGIALTGPLFIHVGEPSAYQAFDYQTNRTNIVGYQLIAEAFDPSTSVRVT